MRNEWPLKEPAIHALVEGTCGDPFAFLGPHPEGERWVVRALLPGARAVTALSPSGKTLAAFRRVHATGLFEAEIGEARDYRLCIDWDGVIEETEDPYSFPPLLGELDVYLLAEGRHRRIAERLGAHAMTYEGVAGVQFAVWAPNARRVSVIGAFNSWMGDGIPCGFGTVAACGRSSFLASAQASSTNTRFSGADGRLTKRADPLARAAERPPATASIVADAKPFAWSDKTWRDAHAARREDAPLAIYEVHAPSWRRHADGRPFSWSELADTLVPYVRDLGFTHVELLPVMLHPFGGSWGYQPLGLFAPMPELGSASRLRRLRRSLSRGGDRRDPGLGPGAFSNRCARARAVRRHCAL